MPVPPFRGLLPAEAIKQLSQWMKQPQVPQAIKDAASKLGIREMPAMTSLQEWIRQAGKWVDNAIEPWREAQGGALESGINGTGELFSGRWIAPRLAGEVVTLFQAIHASTTEDRGLEARCQALFSSCTGAADALVTPNLSVAIQLVVNGLSQAEAIDRVVLPRACCIRIPTGPSPGGAMVRDILDVTGMSIREIGSSTDCDPADFDRALSSGSNLLLLASPTCVHEIHAGGIAAVRRAESLVCDIALDGCLHDLQELGIPSQALSRRWDQGPDLMIVPGQYFLGGPECALILGKFQLIAKIRALAEQTGMLANRETHLMLAESLRRTQSRDDWMTSPVGAVLANSHANLDHRARRIALQCVDIASLETIEVHSRPCRIGSGIWQGMLLESAVLKIIPKTGISPSSIADRLKQNTPPVWCQVQSDSLEIVMRTIDPADDPVLVNALLSLNADSARPASDEPSADSSPTNETNQ